MFLEWNLRNYVISRIVRKVDHELIPIGNFLLSNPANSKNYMFKTLVQSIDISAFLAYSGI